MAALTKFMFDQDFTPGTRQAEKPISAAEQALKLAEAESKGFRDGFNAAEREGAAVAARRMAVAFEQIGDAIDRLARGLTAIEERLTTEAVELAAAIARKLAPELIAREPFAEIAALAADCFKQLASAPHVVVRVNDALHETAKTRLDEIARTRGFEGRLMVLADPEIAVGDCRIEWADGGVIRSQAETNQAIGKAIAHYLGARQRTATPESGDFNE